MAGDENDSDRPATKKDLCLMVKNLRRDMINATVWLVFCTTLALVAVLLIVHRI
jgi:hypothetical protein